MSDFSAKKNINLTTSNVDTIKNISEVSGKIDLSNPKNHDISNQLSSKEARSKKLDETIAKLTATKPILNTKGISDDALKSEQESSKPSALKEKSFAIESKTGLKTLRISTAEKEIENKENSELETQETVSTAPEFRAQKPFQDENNAALSEEEIGRLFDSKPVGRSVGYIIATATGLFLSAAWFSLCANYIFNNMGMGNLFAQQPHILGGFLAGILAPVALLWMVIAFIQRGADINRYSRTLRNEMHTTLFANKNNAGLFEKDLSALMGQASDFSKTSKSALHSIQKARMGLRHDIKNFSNLADEIDAKKSLFSEGSFDGLNDFYTKITNFTAQAEKIEALLSKENIKFDKTETFMQSVQALIERTENMDERVEQRMQNLNKVITSLDDKIALIEQSESKATAKLEGINALSTTSAHNIQRAVEELGTNLKSIQEASDKVTSDVQTFAQSTLLQKEELDKVRQNLDERVENLELTLKAPIEKIERVVEQANIRHEEIDRTLEKRIETLNETAEKAVEKSNIIRNNLRETVQDMSGFVGRIGGYSKSAYAQMQDQVSAFEKSITDTLARVDDAGSSLKSQTAELSNVVNTASTDLSNLDHKISDHRKGVKAETAELYEDLKTYNDTIKNNASDLTSIGNTTRHSIENAAKMFESTADMIVTTSQKVMGEMNATNERFEEIANLFDRKTQSNLENMKSINVIFDKTLEDLKGSATQASIMLEKSGSRLNQYVDNIDQASVSARSKMEETGRVMKDQTDLITISADQAVLKIEAVQQTLNDQHNDMSSLVSEAKTQIEEAGKEFAKRVVEIENSSVKAIEQFSNVNEKAKGQQDYLKEMSDVTNEQIAQMVERFQKQIAGLTSNATNALNELNKSSDGFAERNRKMEDQIQSALITSKKQTADIAKQMRSILESSEKTTQSISDSVAKLSSNMGSLTKAASDISGKVENARNILENETEHMADVSIKASRLVEEAAQSYQKQSSLLFKASEEASNNIDKIREKDFKAQRESFLSNAKYLLESLHSLSVDLTRSLEGRIQEKTWKAYQAGDVAIFTRQIIENKEQLSSKKLAEKYAKDNEFRTYTNRFIRQFEEVYQNSMANDFGDLMAATFATSDVGKLYEILCAIVAHKNIVQTKHAR